MTRKEIERAITEIVNIYCNSQAPLAETQRKMRQPVERLLADEREKAREMCANHLEIVAHRYGLSNPIGQELLHGAEFMRQLDLTKPESDLAASSREEGESNAG